MSSSQSKAKQGLSRYFPVLLAFAAGALTVTAFAPFSLPPLALLGPALLFWLWVDATPRQGFIRGYGYGLGLLGFGVFWMHISIDQFGNIGLAGAIALTLIFVALLALFYGLVGNLACRYAKHPLALTLSLPSLWVLGEWIRGWLFGGFPWLTLGYSQIDMPLAGFAPLLCVYGLSWLLVLSAGLIVGTLHSGVRGRAAALLLLVLIWGSGALLQNTSWTETLGQPFRVSMIQGNIPQVDKWKPAQLSPTLDLYLSETRSHWDSDLVIWPETAVPAFAHVVNQRLLQPLAKEAQENSSQVLMGIPIWQEKDRSYFNGLMQIKDGGVAGQYLKRHLVPFGEFMPLDEWLRPVLTWMKIPMSSFAAGETAQPLLQLAGYPVGLSICYEDAFGNEIADALPDAAYLVNVSNDAWFGDSLAPYQHLEIARMRALETGRDLLRSTNTGVSALINHKGQIMGKSPPFERHVLTGEVTPRAGGTPYVQFGNIVVILAVLCLLVLFQLIARRR